MNSISLEVAEDKSTSLLVWILSDFKAIPLSQLDSLFCSKNRNYFLIIHDPVSFNLASFGCDWEA